MRDPDGVPVEVLDGDDGIVADALGLEGLLDHEVPLAGGEGVLGGVGVLGASDTDGEVLGFIGTLADDLHVSHVKTIIRAFLSCSLIVFMTTELCFLAKS